MRLQPKQTKGYNHMTIPNPTRPAPLEGYWDVKDTRKLLKWEFVAERMEAAKNYWIATVNPNGRPHVVPVWGVWLDNTLYFGGSPMTRWARNLRRYPEVTVHLDDSNEAVILEGTVTQLTDATSALMTRIDDAYEPKYKMRHGPPIWHLDIRKVIAWKSMDTTTRWLFEDDTD
jgi:nitroimidazol reductase NimA-like FMN-containing flavoprotein (pyridoxamine 5'-phosphate oxidase superfamily)